MKLLIRNLMINNVSKIGSYHKDVIKQFRNELLNSHDEKNADYINHNLNTIVKWIDSITEMGNVLILSGDFYKLSSVCNSILSCSIDVNRNINTYSIIPDNIGKFVDRDFLKLFDDVFEECYMKMFVYVNGYLNKIILDKLANDISEQNKDMSRSEIYDDLVHLMDKYKTTVTYSSSKDKDVTFESKCFIDIVNMLYSEDIKKIDSFSFFNNINNIDDILGNDDFFRKPTS